jgi:hypothetical protein
MRVMRVMRVIRAAERHIVKNSELEPVASGARRNVMGMRVAGIAIPDSSMICTATSTVRDREPDILFRHASRIFLFASIIGARRNTSFDPELLYVATLFHNFGLSPQFRGSKCRFEVDGANAARQFLAGCGVPEHDISEVWNAIALHTTFGIGEHLSPLVRLMTAGVETDLMSRHFDEVPEDQRREILKAFPRGRGFKSLIIEAFAEGMCWRPETTFGTVNADILDRYDPNYRRINYCGLILGSEWTD